MSLLPNYTISHRIGSSGNTETPPNVPIEWIEQIGHTRFNPFRDIQFGGTLIRWKGKNRWVSDKSFIGKILKFIFL